MEAIGSVRLGMIVGWRWMVAVGVLLSLNGWPAIARASQSLPGVEPAVPRLIEAGPILADEVTRFEEDAREDRSGECQTVPSCSNFNANYPPGTFSTTSASFIVVDTCIYAGDFAYYSVTQGQTYEWSLCSADGGHAPYDSQLTLWDQDGATHYCFSDDYCYADYAGKIAWTATFTGIVRVLVSQYPCGNNTTCTTLVWRCASCPADTAVIADAWWSDEVDQDGDGCRQSARLNWNPDVADCSGTLTVFEKIYWKPGSAGTWTLWTTTGNHTITDCIADTWYVDCAFDTDCGPFDWKIELYRVGQSSPDYTRDPSNDDDLNDYPEERAADDVGICVGDLNCDGQIGFGDINPFVLYLSNTAAWQSAFPGCNPLNGDINGDGTYGQAVFDDINPFVAVMSQCGMGCPCPGPAALP